MALILVSLNGFLSFAMLEFDQLSFSYHLSVPILYLGSAGAAEADKAAWMPEGGDWVAFTPCSSVCFHHDCMCLHVL